MRKAALTAAVTSCFLISSCSSQGGDESDDGVHLKGTLCDTDISTKPLQEMYPGPYTSIKMFPSKGGGIDALSGAGGKTEGDCDVWITQKEGDDFTKAKIAAYIEPGTSAEDLFKNYKKWYPKHRRQRLTLGPADGFTMYNQAVLGFDCRDSKKRPSVAESLGITVQVFLPDHPAGTNVDRAELAAGAAKLAANTARYVNSEVLKCSGPSLPDGAPRQEPSSAP